MKKILLIIFAFFFLTWGFNQPAEAAKRLLPRFRSGTGTTSSYSPSRSYSGVSVSLKLRTDKQALIVSFANLQNASSVAYSLTYNTNGKPEGVGGTIKPSGESSASRTLLFGTCSGGVCRYHTNITNMRFKVTSKLTSGKTSIKRYRVRL